MVRLYQNIPLEGVSWQNANRVESKFWNEGKWDNFISPLLSDDCSDHTFVEMGCNAGLFLKLAEDRGYRNIVGVEKDRTPVNEGLRYRASIGYNYKIIKRTLGGKFGEDGDFDIDELPLADVTVMSTFHYYIGINAWIKYLDRLKSKSVYCLLVSRPRMKRLHWKAYSSLEALQGYFGGWEQAIFIDGVSQDGDPSPRNLFSVLFKSPVLERIPIDDIHIRESEDDSMYLAMKDLALIVSGDKHVNRFETEYYKKWVERKKGRWKQKTIDNFVSNKFELMMSIKENGQKEPLIINSDGKLSDGGHRLVILKALGYKSAVVRRI